MLSRMARVWQNVEVRKTTVYLPQDLKDRLEQVAKQEKRSEAEIIRSALDSFTMRRARPRPTVPLFRGRGVTNVAENVDEALAEGFGRS